jgi:hypothetical protein
LAEFIEPLSDSIQSIFAVAKFQGVGVATHGLVLSSEGVQEEALVRPSGGVAGVDLQCSVIGGESLLIPAKFSKRNALVVPGVGLLGVNFQGLIEALERLLIAIQSLERGALDAEGIRRSRIVSHNKAVPTMFAGQRNHAEAEAKMPKETKPSPIAKVTKMDFHLV